MTWVKIDDRITEHPKFLELPGSAVALWLHGLMYCSRNETDGYVPRAFLRSSPSVPRPFSSASRLVLAGLWIEHDDDFEVYDYLKYQRSALQIQGERDSVRRRVAKHRKSHSPEM